MFEEEYVLPFFEKNGFERRVCPKCNIGYWTQSADQQDCGDTPCVEYSFIGNSPFTKEMGLDEMREAFLGFFERNQHTRLSRFPVVARWRDDVFLVNASIYDFQPHVTSGLVPPPANPLCISQPCIRMTDLESVGRTGKHLTGFEMMAHHVFNPKDEPIYWKDKTVEYCHRLLVDDLGARSDEITYKEKPWIGGGNAGPSLEVLLRGLELATLVFMNLRVDPNGPVDLEGVKYSNLDLNVVDTGYGLERFVWMSKATPTIYESIYPERITELMKAATIDIDLKDPDIEKLFREYSKIAGLLDMSSDTDPVALRKEVVTQLNNRDIDITQSRLKELMDPLEKVYGIIDHSRSLTFMLFDGLVPSNAKAGYLARLLARRTLRLLEGLGNPVTLSDLARSHYKQFGTLFGSGDIDLVAKMLDLEQSRYNETMEKGKRLIARYEGPKKMEISDLLEFYDTHGLHPEQVRQLGSDLGLEVVIPENFDALLAERHETSVGAPVQLEQEQMIELPPTKKLYYDRPKESECQATVLYVEGKDVVLEKTLFYPEGGGQKSDTGTFVGEHCAIHIVHTFTKGNIIVHRAEKDVEFQVGEIIQCTVDWDRRMSLTRHHSVTHLVLAACREILGPHIWQSGASKGVESARLDITHYQKVSQAELQLLEAKVNEFILANIPVTKTVMNRDEAEQKHGFRLYQGGVPPSKELRVVRIGELDVEACAGTHVATTLEIGMFKMLGTERIQDGVVRLEYCAGMAAIRAVARMETLLVDASDVLSVRPDELPRTVNRFYSEWKDQKKEIERLRTQGSSGGIENLIADSIIIGDKKIIAATVDDPDLLPFAKELASKSNTAIILTSSGKSGRAIIARSKNLNPDLDCADILRQAGEAAGNQKGGGKPDFAQGGGFTPEQLKIMTEKAVELIRKTLG